MIGCFAEVSERLEFRVQTDQEAFDTGCRHLKDSADAVLAWEEDKSNWDALRLAEVAAMQAAAQFEAVGALEGLGKALVNAGGALFRASSRGDLGALERSVEALERAEGVFERSPMPGLADMARLNRAGSLARLASARKSLSLGEAALKAYSEIDTSRHKGVAGFERVVAGSIATVRNFVGAERVVRHVEEEAHKATAEGGTREALLGVLGLCEGARGEVERLEQRAHFARLLAVEGLVQSTAAHELGENGRLVSAAACFSSAAIEFTRANQYGSEDFGKSIAALHGAFELLQGMAATYKFDSASENVLRTKEEHRTAAIRDEVVDLPLEGAGRVLGSSSDNEEEARIDRDPAAVATDVDAGTAFASAVERAREAVRDVAAHLQGRIDSARRYMPTARADREALAREINEAIRMGVKVEVGGTIASSLAFNRDALVWRVGSGKTASFRKSEASVAHQEGSQAVSGQLDR